MKSLNITFQLRYHSIVDADSSLFSAISIGNHESNKSILFHIGGVELSSKWKQYLMDNKELSHWTNTPIRFTDLDPLSVASSLPSSSSLSKRMKDESENSFIVQTDQAYHLFVCSKFSNIDSDHTNHALDALSDIVFLIAFEWARKEHLIVKFDLIVSLSDNGNIKVRFDIGLTMQVDKWNKTDSISRNMFLKTILPLFSSNQTFDTRDKQNEISNHSLILLKHSEEGHPTIFDVYLSCRANMLIYGLENTSNTTILTSASNPAPLNCRNLQIDLPVIDKFVKVPNKSLISLANIPDNMHMIILEFLSIQSQRYLRCTCAYWKDLIDGNRFSIKGLKCKLYSHQIRSLAWMEQRELGEIYTNNDDISDPLLKGGILADEPGLGKTISIISLILRSFGSFSSPFSALTSKTSLPSAGSLDETPAKKQINLRTTSLWNEMNDSQREEVIRSFIPSSAPKFIEEAFEDIIDCQSSFTNLPQISLVLQQKLRNKASLTDIKSIVDSIMKLSETLDTIPKRQTPSRMSKEKIAQADSNLIDSGATLIITPPGLLQHWVSQIHKAIDFNYWNPSDCVGKPIKADKNEALKQHPLLFIDHRDGEGELPHPKILSRYAIVVVSIKRISKEARNFSKTSLDRSSLRRINWLRIVVDEGHQLGNSSSVPDHVEFIRDIISERRWILSGTPAKETTPRASLQSILGILCFLRHDKFGKKGGVSLWRKEVSHPFLFGSNQAKLINHSKASQEQGQQEGMDRTKDDSQIQKIKEENYRGFTNLCSILKGVMVRHIKDDVEIDLPKLKRKTITIELTPIEKRSYNAVAMFIRANISLTSIDPAKGWALSFLNPKNYKAGRQALEDIRLACQGLQKIPYLSPQSAVDFAVEISKANVPENIKPQLIEYTNRVQTGVQTECMKCGIKLPFLHVTPCAHFFCPECFMDYFHKARDNNKVEEMNSCMICKKPMDATTFALFQPGFELKWMSETEALQKPSSKAEYLISALETIRKQNPFAKCLVYSSFQGILNLAGNFLIRHFGVDSIAEYWGKYQDTELAKFCTGRCETWRCSLCGYDRNDPLSKSCNRIILDVNLVQNVHDGAATHSELKLKSDNVPGWIHNQVFTKGEILRVPRASVGLDVTENMTDEEKMVNVRIVNWKKCKGKIPPRSEWIEHRNTDCFVMLLHREGALGLDLSMVSHIFLVDRIADSAVEDQIISRAYRLGSTVSELVVEQLICPETIEESCPPGMSYVDIMQSMRALPS